MNLAHLHLLLNHFPILGTMIGTGLYLASFVGKKNQDLRKSALIILVAMAVIAIPTFLTGFGADLKVRVDPDTPEAVILRHEGAAMLAIWFMLVTGALAIVELWQTHQHSRPARWNVAAVVVFSLLTVGLMARVGNTGGDIRHPEIRDNPTAPITEDTLGSIIHKFEPNPDAFSSAMIGNVWWWWVLMALHFIGLALIVGTVGILDIRIMGFIKQIPAAPLCQFIPWSLVGLAVNITTGMLAFIGPTANYIPSLGFWLKILALMLLGVNAALFYMTDIFGDVEQLKAGEDASMPAKLVAASGLFLWFAVIAFGRYIQPTSGLMHLS